MKFQFPAFVFLALLQTALPGYASEEPNACLRHNINDPEVPECPAKGTEVLSDSYPALAVTISDVTGGTAWVKSFVENVIKAVPDKPPQFMMNVTPETYSAVKSAVEKMEGSPEQKKVWLSSLSRVEGGMGWNWQQDFMQGVVNNGKPLVRPNGTYNRAAAARDATINKLAEVCNVPSGQAFAEEEHGEDGYSGGNIEGGPEGLCVIGDGDIGGYAWKAFADDICGKSSPKVRAPTSFLNVGHTDEIYTTVRTGPGLCDIAVLVANPKVGLEALRKSPNGNALPLLNNAASSENLTKYYLRLCDSLSRRKQQLEDNTRVKPNRSVAGMPASREPASVKSRVSDKNDESDQCYLDLSKLTNAQLVDLIESDPQLNLTNEGAGKLLNGFKGDLEKKLGKDGCPSPKMVELPMLFKGLVTDRGIKNGLRDLKVSKAGGIFPNPTNLQQFGDTVLMSDPGNESLRADLKNRIESLNGKLQVKFLDTSQMHAKQGNLHCSTNTIRYCRPQK